MNRHDPEALARARRIHTACERFESAWRTGERPCIEEFARTGQEPADRKQLLAELIALEIDLRAECGEAVDPAEYHDRFPDAASSITTVFEASAVPSARPARSDPPSGPNAYGDNGSSSRDDSTAAPFENFGDYELIEEIARGGMGVVYKARQKSLKRFVALKMVLSGRFASQAELERFLQEAELAANLDHPHIVPIHEIGTHDGRHYFSMKLIDGESLSRRVSGFANDPDAAARLTATIARAVHFAHQRGFLHCDLKPANILLDARGEPHVTDFGLAKRVGDSTMTISGAILGTPSYMAPEQASGHRSLLTSATDIYGLGAILYELLTGRPPFRTESLMETVVEVMEREPKPLREVRPSVPEGLERICLKCLEKSPKDRYASAEELAENLERYLRGEDVEGTSLGARLRRWTRREPELVSRMGGLALMATLNEYNYYSSKTATIHAYLVVLTILSLWALSSLFFQMRVRRGLRADLSRIAWSATDIILLTMLLKILGAMESTLVVGYPLLIAASGLWYRVQLVWLTTIFAMSAYGLLVIDKLMFAPYWKSAQFPNIFLAALAVNGFVVARQVKRIRALSSYYERRPIP